MNYKGAGSMLSTLAVITAIIVAGLASAGISWFQSLDQNIRLDSISIAEGRMESVIYAVDAFEDAKVQINYRGEYNISVENGDALIIYEAPNEDRYSSRPINSPVDFSVSEGRSSSFCLKKTKEDPVEVVPGEC